jgi:hypothetical protein
MHNFFGNLGLTQPSKITADGTPQRIGTLHKPKGKDGWYIAKEYNGHIYLIAGNWQSGEQSRYTDNGVDQSGDTNWAALAAEAKADRERMHKIAADKTAELIPTLKPVESHPYLEKKNINPYGEVYRYYQKIIIPIYNREQLVGYQSIDQNGDKLFLAGTDMRGGYAIIPGNEMTTYIVEGYATGCTVHEATGNRVIVAFNAYNLKRVADQFKGLIIVCADNDKSGVGEQYAKGTGKPFLMPPDVGTDFNDIGVEETRKILNPRTDIAVLPETDTQAEQILFPAETIYSKAPEVYKRIYGEWMDSIVEPVAGFAFATIEAAMQVLCGQKILTPAHNRTVVTFALCGSHSGAGKDLSSKNPLRKLRNQLISSMTGTIADHGIYDHLTTGIGNITGDTAMILTAEDYNGSFLWLTTEASEPLRQLSSNASQANQGSSLATALNDSYDGHEITGKRKAGQALKAVNYPLIPVCWLTQLSELKQQLTQKLLEIGTLGRFDYILDYNPIRSVRSSFEGVPVVGEDADQDEIDKIVNPFSEKTIELIADAVAHRPEGSLVFTPASRDYIIDLDIDLRKRFNSTEGIGKFVCRTMMSVEKRLTAWVAMDGRRVIEVSDIEAIIPWMEYQIAMREQVYNREIRKDSDLLKAVKDTIQKLLQSGYGPVSRKSGRDKEYRALMRQGFVSRTDFNARFKTLYNEAFPKYMEASALDREINVYIKQAELAVQRFDTFAPDFLYIPNYN